MIKITSIISIILFLCYFFFIFLLHFKQKNISIISNAVSDYGTTENKKYFMYAGIANALANIALAISFVVLPVNFSERNLAVITLILRSIMIFGVIYFPTDIGNELKSKSSKLHLVFAIVQFTLIAVFVFNIRAPLYNLKGHQFNDFMHILEYFVEIGLIGLSAGLIFKKLKKYFGIFERVFLFSSTLFLIFTALVLHKLY